MYIYLTSTNKYVDKRMRRLKNTSTNEYVDKRMRRLKTSTHPATYLIYLTQPKPIKDK